MSREDEFVKLYQEGLTMEEIAVRFLTHKKAVSTVLKERGVPIRAKGRAGKKMVELDIDKAKRLILEGLTMDVVASRLGTSAFTLSRRLKEAGLSFSALHRFTKKK